MQLTRSMNLSPSMFETIKIIEKYGKLVRWEGGFWTFEGVETKGTVQGGFCEIPVPSWYCTVKTLRALHSRGLVEFDEINQICSIKLT